MDRARLADSQQLIRRHCAGCKVCACKALRSVAPFPHPITINLIACIDVDHKHCLRLGYGTVYWCGVSGQLDNW